MTSSTSAQGDAAYLQLTLPAEMRLGMPAKTVEEAEAGSGAEAAPTKTVSTSLPFLPVSLVRATACTNFHTQPALHPCNWSAALLSSI